MLNPGGTFGDELAQVQRGGQGVGVIDREVDDPGRIQADLDLSRYTEDQVVEPTGPAPKAYWSRMSHWP
jgi:hypothetical protein